MHASETVPHLPMPTTRSAFRALDTDGRRQLLERTRSCVRVHAALLTRHVYGTGPGDTAAARAAVAVWVNALASSAAACDPQPLVGVVPSALLAFLEVAVPKVVEKNGDLGEILPLLRIIENDLIPKLVDADVSSCQYCCVRTLFHKLRKHLGISSRRNSISVKSGTCVGCGCLRRVPCNTGGYTHQYLIRTHVLLSAVIGEYVRLDHKIQATAASTNGGDGSGSECIVCKEATTKLQQLVSKLLYSSAN
eukprot:m.406467 g.406467  ORF g.406467 m.406467 type:complete len:250 (+) comp21216_c0_seq1:819-1568(+)